MIDIAIKARMIPNRQALTFPIDGHLTDSGHAHLAGEAAPVLAALIERKEDKPALERRLAARVGRDDSSSMRRRPGAPGAVAARRPAR